MGWYWYKIFIIFLMFISLQMFVCVKWRDHKNWNRGICPDCGTRWVYLFRTRRAVAWFDVYECECKEHFNLVSSRKYKKRPVYFDGINNEVVLMNLKK